MLTRGTTSFGRSPPFLEKTLVGPKDIGAPWTGALILPKWDKLPALVTGRDPVDPTPAIQSGPWPWFLSRLYFELP